MGEQMAYLNWLVGNTRTTWWHDSADRDELTLALKYGASGVTTNPALNTQALRKGGATGFPELAEGGWRKLPADERCEWLTTIAVKRVARMLEPQYHASRGERGYVCAQVNPNLAGDREAMLPMARRFSALGPNIAVKLPATSAGLDVLEQCIGEGITCTATVSFTVAQVLETARRHARAIQAAAKNGVTPGRCFSVIMIGRIDDYLREVAADNRAEVNEAMIRQAGLAVVKRVHAMLEREGSHTRLCVAALRGVHHMVDLAGGDLIMSIHPKYQEPLRGTDLACEKRMERPVDPAVVDRLMKMREFVRAYEPDGLKVGEFVSYGVTQRTLSQFCETGWNALEGITG